MPVLDQFQNDEAIAKFMVLQTSIPSGDHKEGFVMELEQEAYFGGEIVSSSHEIKKDNVKIRMRSPRENYYVVLSDPEKRKIKEKSKGENLFEVLEDGGFNLPIFEYQEKSALLFEEAKPINAGIAKTPKITYHAASLDPEEKVNFSKFINERKINFAWTYSNMLGLDAALVVHHLAVFLRAKPIKQKLQNMHPQITLLVKLELKKLLSVGVIKPIDHPEWILNLVPVSKPIGGIIIYMDFQDLNKACPKDDFPLPRIDMIVDLIVGHKILPLMDDFSRYNQIKISIDDQHKTTFTCAWGTFCWNIISFGLKNARATYQQAMTTIFHDMLHTTMEDYVDDILEKSIKREDHLTNLAKMFDRLEQYNLRLNSKK